MSVWNLILESNTFNFIVLVIIIAFLMKKVNAGTALENIKNTGRKTNGESCFSNHKRIC